MPSILGLLVQNRSLRPLWRDGRCSHVQDTNDATRESMSLPHVKFQLSGCDFSARDVTSRMNHGEDGSTRLQNEIYERGSGDDSFMGVWSMCDWYLRSLEVLIQTPE